jgi:segregation and condensation protein A
VAGPAGVWLLVLLAEARAIPYTVKLPQFEGPLDLLLSLVQQGQVDLREVPLGRIAEDYLAAARHQLDLEEATEVLWMLAALIEMKSRLLVPKPTTPEEPLPEPEEPFDLNERLEEKLEEYRAFKEVATALRALEDYQHRVFARPETEDPNAVFLEGVSLDDLFRAFQQVLERAKDEVGEIPTEEVKVAERMEAILDLLAQHREGVLFSDLFKASTSKLNVIVTFLALLELIKNRRIRAQQPQRFAAIRLMLVTA